MSSTSDIYVPLLDSHLIRHLRIEQSSTATNLQCSIWRTELVHGSDYTALSYTWGASRPSKEIWVQSEHGWEYPPRRLYVGQNLFDFLVAYTTQPWGRSREGVLRPRLWIDQICIDQSNTGELSAQVSIMNKIYKRAKDVLVWLGCEAAMVEAMRQLRDHESQADRALVMILQHPYFSRVWIVQEIALGPKITFVCGEVEVSWGCMEEASLRLQGNAVDRIPLQALAVTLDTRSPRYRTLQACFFQYSQNHCRDPRDRVYGLLGLTPERWRLRVDYTKTVLEVYLDTVVALYEELFDVTDPKSFYPPTVQDTSDLFIYRNTMLDLAQAMGLPEHQLSGLHSFLIDIGDVYMSTQVRNVRFQLPADQLPFFRDLSEAYINYEGASRVASSTSSTRMNTARRRNPLLRDVISELGLQLAQTPRHAGQCDDDPGGPRWDRWWFTHNGRTRYFECAIP